MESPSALAVTHASVLTLPKNAPGMAQLQELRDGFSAALGLLFMAGFFWAVIKIWGGANAISKGDSEGKSGIIAAILIAGAAAIVGALYAIFGMRDAALTPRF